MKLRTLPNGNLNLEGIKFVTQTGYLCTIGEHQTDMKNKSCHYISWIDDQGDTQRHLLEYTDIIDCFRKRIWVVQKTGTPAKIFKKFSFTD